MFCVTQDAHATTASDGMDKEKGETKYVRGRGRACPVKDTASAKSLPGSEHGYSNTVVGSAYFLFLLGS